MTWGIDLYIKKEAKYYCSIELGQMNCGDGQRCPSLHRLRVLGSSKYKALREKPRRPLVPQPSLPTSAANLCSLCSLNLHLSVSRRYWRQLQGKSDPLLCKRKLANIFRIHTVLVLQGQWVKELWRMQHTVLEFKQRFVRVRSQHWVSFNSDSCNEGSKVFSNTPEM
jgi:hypothetical protein